jgi:hypothetical protein
MIPMKLKILMFKALGLLAKHAKTIGTNPKSFLFIYGYFPKDQNSQHDDIDVRVLLRGVRVGHSMSWQGRTPTSYKSI